MVQGLPLSGRVAVVTGVSRRIGIGFAVARRLGELGAAVYIHGFAAHDAAQPWGADASGVAGLAQELQAGGLSIGHGEGDLADPDAPVTVFDAAQRAFGHVDILVANHARSGHGRLDGLTAAELDAFLDVNVRATLLLCREFSLRHDGRAAGRIVMMTSGQHLQGMPREVAYAVSKGAVHQATATLAAELVTRGITVNTVNPGPTDTGWDIGDPSAAMPQGRWGTPEDAARLIGWLCTDDASWLTGQVFDSEGGFRR